MSQIKNTLKNLLNFSFLLLSRDRNSKKMCKKLSLFKLVTNEYKKRDNLKRRKFQCRAPNIPIAYMQLPDIWWKPYLYSEKYTPVEYFNKQ